MALCRLIDLHASQPLPYTARSGSDTLVPSESCAHEAYPQTGGISLRPSHTCSRTVRFQLMLFFQPCLWYNPVPGSIGEMHGCIHVELSAWRLQDQNSPVRFGSDWNLAKLSRNTTLPPHSDSYQMRMTGTMLL